MTTPDQFTLTISLGNDAMQTPHHVAIALAEVAARLAQDFDPIQFGAGRIRDGNGNTVGEWRVTGP